MSEQVRAWMGEFGREYTARNAMTLEEMEELCRRNYGVSRTELNRRFLQGLDRLTSILEVGANIGNQLICLQKMGFSRLCGIELQTYAIELSKSRHDIPTVRGSAFSIPFADASFDLVLTSGLLIHVKPSQVAKVMKEMHRCSREYIWGLEYYADEATEVLYRGRENLLWKCNYPRLFLDLFDDLELVMEERLRYLTGDLVDTMYLLRKKSLKHSSAETCQIIQEHASI